jgi:hypothetical protein
VCDREIEETARSMGVEIQESLRRLKESIEALPDDLTHETRDVCLSLIEKNVALEKELADAVAKAEDHAQRLECVYGAIVESLLPT